MWKGESDERRQWREKVMMEEGVGVGGSKG